MIFSCTSKVLKRVKSVHEVEDKKVENGYHNWYVDEIILNRKKYFIFTNSVTLFSFITYFGTKNEIQNFCTIFVDSYEEQLIRLYGQIKSLRYQDENEKVSLKFLKTNDRSILGSMNDFKLNASSRILRDGFNSEILNSINYYTNQMPMGYLKYGTPFQIHKNYIFATE